MNLDARLHKLEATHKKILRCLACRFSLRDILPSRFPEYKDSCDALLVKCWSYGTRFFISVARRTERQREIIKLIHMTHPVKFYTEERAHTAKLWPPLSRSQVKRHRARKQELRALRSGKRVTVSPFQSNPDSMVAEQRKAKQEREQLRYQALEFLRKEQERCKLLARGVGVLSY